MALSLCPFVSACGCLSPRPRGKSLMTEKHIQRLADLTVEPQPRSTNFTSARFLRGDGARQSPLWRNRCNPQFGPDPSASRLGTILSGGVQEMAIMVSGIFSFVEILGRSWFVSVCVVCISVSSMKAARA